MGRSVSYPSGALVGFYDIDSTCDECEGKGCDYCGNSGFYDVDFDEEIEDLQGRIKELFPSFDEADRWIDREDHVIAENRLVAFGVSEYCGMVSVWLLPLADSGLRDAYQHEANRPLAEHWIEQVKEKFLSRFSTLSKIATASNGESYYRRIEGHQR